MANFHKLLGVLGLLAASAVPVSAAPSEDAVAFAKVIAANGCVVTEANAEKIQGEIGFDSERGKAAAMSLMQEELIAMGPSGAALDEDYCIELGGAPAVAEAEAPSAEEAKFIEVMTANDCRLTGPETETFLASTGLTSAEAEKILTSLALRGLVVMGSDALELKTEGCN